MSIGSSLPEVRFLQAGMAAVQQKMSKEPADEHKHRKSQPAIKWQKVLLTGMSQSQTTSVCLGLKRAWAA